MLPRFWHALVDSMKQLRHNEGYPFAAVCIGLRGDTEASEMAAVAARNNSSVLPPARSPT